MATPGRILTPGLQDVIVQIILPAVLDPDRVMIYFRRPVSQPQQEQAPRPPPEPHPAETPQIGTSPEYPELRPAPPEIEFSPAPTDNIQPDSTFHRLSNELLAIIFEYLNSLDHYSLRQTSITFYHIIHSKYSEKRRLVIKSLISPKPSQHKLLNKCISVCMGQSTALNIDIARGEIREFNFELTYSNVTRHLILFRHAVQVTQLVLAQFRYNSINLVPSAMAHLIGGLSGTMPLEMIKLINYSGDGNPFYPIIIQGLAQHSPSLRHFSFYSRCENIATFHSFPEQLAFFHGLEELYIGSYNTCDYRRDELLASEVAATRRLGFYQNNLNDIIGQIETMPEAQAVRITHLTVRNLDGRPHVLTDALRGQIRDKVPNAELL